MIGDLIFIKGSSKASGLISSYQKIESAWNPGDYEYSHVAISLGLYSVLHATREDDVSEDLIHVLTSNSSDIRVFRNSKAVSGLAETLKTEGVPDKLVNLCISVYFGHFSNKIYSIPGAIQKNKNNTYCSLLARDTMQKVFGYAFNNKGKLISPMALHSMVSNNKADWNDVTVSYCSPLILDYFLLVNLKLSGDKKLNLSWHKDKLNSFCNSDKFSPAAKSRINNLSNADLSRYARLTNNICVQAYDYVKYSQLDSKRSIHDFVFNTNSRPSIPSRPVGKVGRYFEEIWRSRFLNGYPDGFLRSDYLLARSHDSFFLRVIGPDCSIREMENILAHGGEQEFKVQFG